MCLKETPLWKQESVGKHPHDRSCVVGGDPQIVCVKYWGELQHTYLPQVLLGNSKVMISLRNIFASIIGRVKQSTDCDTLWYISGGEKDCRHLFLFIKNQFSGAEMGIQNPFLSVIEAEEYPFLWFCFLSLYMSII